MTATKTLPRLSAGLLLLAACAKNYAYQNTRWGMTEKAVNAVRPSSRPMAASSGERFLFEPATINGQKATVAYRFAGNALVGVTTVFEQVEMDKARYLDFYRQVKELLIEKYGSPEFDAAGMAAMTPGRKLDEDRGRFLWRGPGLMIALSCEGECDGSSKGNSVTISYEPPVSRTEGL